MIREKESFTKPSKLQTRLVKFDEATGEDTLEWSHIGNLISVSCKYKCPFRLTYIVKADSPEDKSITLDYRTQIIYHSHASHLNKIPRGNTSDEPESKQKRLFNKIQTVDKDYFSITPEDTTCFSSSQARKMFKL